MTERHAFTVRALGAGRWTIDCSCRQLAIDVPDSVLAMIMRTHLRARAGEISVGQVWAGKRWGRHLTVRAIRTEHDETLIDFTYGIDGLVLRTMPAAELLEHWRLER